MLRLCLFSARHITYPWMLILQDPRECSNLFGHDITKLIGQICCENTQICLFNFMKINIYVRCKQKCLQHLCIPYKILEDYNLRQNSKASFFGYDRNYLGEFIIWEEQAKVVKYIFSTYACGYSLAFIANELKQMGIP